MGLPHGETLMELLNVAVSLVVRQLTATFPRVCVN
jgi:hypothetical protein